MEVYIDLYFLINVSMDLLCLLITARLLHLRTSAVRLLVGALTGGAYAVFSLLRGSEGALQIALDLLAAVAIASITFLKKDRKKTHVLRFSAVFALSSVVLGGMMTALYSLLNQLDLPLEAATDESASVWLFGLVTLASALLTLRGGRFLGFSDKTRHVDVEAVLLGNAVTLRALVDSGNLLRDPVSGRSVIVADRKKLRHALPDALLQDGRAGERAMVEWMEKHPKNASRVRLIPTKTATGRAFLVGVVPDSLVILENGERTSAAYVVAASTLEINGADFDALIPKI